jgi:large subunit ribosomal protein L13
MVDVIVDADDMIAGRLASSVAKMLLNGDSVKIINADKSVIVGNPVWIFQEYTRKVSRGDPYHGAFYPRIPERILRRIIRGMLPYTKANGKAAFKRLRVHDGVPEELKGKDAIKIKKVENTHKAKYISLKKLSEKLGGI